MASYTWAGFYCDEISYTRSQTYTFERSDHYCTGDASLTAGVTGYLRPVLQSPGARGWDRYKVTGTVYNVDGDPVPGADVYLMWGDFKGFTVVQHVQSNASGVYIFYVEDKETEYSAAAWFWDAGLGEYIRGVTDRNLKASAS
jgi:protocatechuate 3,4-dioxygenase beta subunit